MSDVRLEAWAASDHALLAALLADPAMTVHIGGPESAEKIAERQRRYEKRGSGQFRIVVDGQPAGWVGYWEKDWTGTQVWEVGWSVVPRLQGRGAATEATRQLLSVMRAAGLKGEVHAFPSVDNAASNAVCRKVGFELRGAFDFEYPPGRPLRCNDWSTTL